MSLIPWRHVLCNNCNNNDNSNNDNNNNYSNNNKREGTAPPLFQVPDSIREPMQFTNPLAKVRAKTKQVFQVRCLS